MTFLMHEHRDYNEGLNFSNSSFNQSNSFKDLDSNHFSMNSFDYSGN